ncbi:hypothetical protein BH23GEM11_BH23GEM11_11150 [soil metagenome]
MKRPLERSQAHVESATGLAAPAAAASAGPAVFTLLVLAGLLSGLPVPAPLMGQSLFSSGGIGAPTDAPDGRARMLGGVGLGLSGAYYSPLDPAAAGRLVLPGISASMESSSEVFGDDDPTGRTRFPFFGIAYPYRGNVYTLGFTGVLSQEWRTQVDRVIDFGDGLLVDAVDRFESEGGIGSAQVGMARQLAPAFSVGANVGWYLGSVERSFERQLDPVEVGSEVEFFRVGGLWRAEGNSITGSASWQMSSTIRLGAGATWSSDLDLVPEGETTGETVSVPMPLVLRIGGYAALTPGLGLTASVSRADWSDAAAALDDADAPGAVLQWGVGAEWTGGTLRDRRVPLAVGYRSGDLPFSFLGEAATESAVTGGFGIHLAETEGVPLALAHVGLERGSRQAGAAEETFWRTTVTFRISAR